MNDHRDHEIGEGRQDAAPPHDSAFDARIAQVLTSRADVLVIEDRPFRLDLADGGMADDPLGTADPSDPFDDAIIELDLDRREEHVAATETGLAGDSMMSRRSSRHGAAVWMAGLAAAAVLVVAIVAFNNSRATSVATYTGGSGLLVTEPTFVPSWVPEGLQLQDLTVRPPLEREPIRAHRQLLESTTSDAAMLLHVEIDRPSFVPLGTELAARGTTVGVRPSLETIGSVPLTELRWSEGDADISATTRDLAESDAAVLLDSLTWVDPADPLAGFAPPAGWTVRAEPAAGTGSGAETTLTYGDPTRPSQAVLTVRAMPPAEVAPGYLLTAMVGDGRDDGVVVATLEPSIAGTSPITYAYWPDGRRVEVSGDDRLDGATAEQIALGVRPSNAGEIASMGAELSQRLGVGVVLAAADLPAGRVELVGAPDPAAVCLTVDGTRTCRAMASGRGTRPNISFEVGSTAVGPTWFLFGASREGIQITDDETSEALFPVLRDGKPIDPDMPMKISAPTVNDGEWYLSVLAVRDDAEQAYVTGDGATITVGRTLI